MAIPVALLTIGNLLNITYVETSVVAQSEFPEIIPEFTYMRTTGNFLTFSGTLILYGTAVPKLFEGFRDNAVAAVTAAVTGARRDTPPVEEEENVDRKPPAGDQ